MLKVLFLILPTTYLYIQILGIVIRLPSDNVGIWLFSISTFMYGSIVLSIIIACYPRKEDLLRTQAIRLIEKEEREKDLKAQEVREKAKEKKILDTMERIKNKKE